MTTLPPRSHDVLPRPAGCGHHSPINPQSLVPSNITPELMKHLSALLVLTLATALSSCAAGRIDRTEDRMDRREDRVDRRHYSGPGDRAEDYLDKRENVNDKLRGRRGLLY